METKNFILTEGKRELIKNFLKNRFYAKIIIILNNLEELKENGLLNDIKNLVRNSGRSNMISISEIQSLIDEVENAKPKSN